MKIEGTKIAGERRGSKNVDLLRSLLNVFDLNGA